MAAILSTSHTVPGWIWIRSGPDLSVRKRSKNYRHVAAPRDPGGGRVGWDPLLTVNANSF